MMKEPALYLKGKSLLTLADFSREEIEYIIHSASKLKQMQKENKPHQYLKGKTLAMVSKNHRHGQGFLSK